MSRNSVRWAFNWAQWNPTEQEFLRAISCVQLEEKERLERFVFRKDARASLAGRLLMRKFVNEFASVPYNEIRFSRDPNGRPVLGPEIKNLSFNVSHQGQFTVLAGETGNLSLGVDVMKLEYTGGKKLSEFFRIMNRNFSPLEWQTIRGSESTPESEQIAMFCRHWSLKESYVKAIGVGITVDLARISFKTYSNLLADKLVTDTELYLDGVKQNWLFEESMLDWEHCVAVAMQENGAAPECQNIIFQKIDYGLLMENAVPLFPEDFDYCRKYFAKQEKPGYCNY